MGMPSPLPVRDGVGATRLHVPLTGAWPTVSAYMVERFFHLEPERLLERFDRGDIVRADGSPVARDAILGSVEFVWYYREPAVETRIPFEVEILHQDEHLVVVDKPHFLPTTPVASSCRTRRWCGCAASSTTPTSPRSTASIARRPGC